MRPRLLTTVLALSLALPAGGWLATSATATPTTPWPASPAISVQTWSSSPVSTYEVAVGADRSVYVTTPTGVLAFSWASVTAQFVTPPRTITPPVSGTGSTLSSPEGIAVSPDGTKIAVAYDGDGTPGSSGVAVYPASASGATTPVRIVGQPAGASISPCSYGVRGVAWDSADVLYVATCGYSGATGWPTTSSTDMQVWAFPESALATDAPSRVIGPFAGWGEFTHMSIVGSDLAVTGSDSSGRPVAFSPLVSSGSGAIASSDVMYPDTNPNFGFTADAAGWMYVSSYDTPGKLMAFAPGSRGAATAIEVLGSGVPHSMLGFDPVDGSVIAVEWGGGCCNNGSRDTSVATADLRRIAIGGALPTPSPSTPPAPSAPAADPGSGSGGGSGSATAPATSASAPADPTGAAGAAGAPGAAGAAGAAEAASVIAPTAANERPVDASASVAGLVGLRLIARGSTGRTCLGTQCVTGRRWALQMCLPTEASISVQRRSARRWTALPARVVNLAPLACPAPTRSVTVAVPRRPSAGTFRILLRIKGAPSLLSSLRVT